MDKSGDYSMDFKARTTDESLSSNILMKNVPYETCNKISNNGVRATHVVVGVSYGGSCNLDLITVSKMLMLYYIFLMLLVLVIY